MAAASIGRQHGLRSHRYLGTVALAPLRWRCYVRAAVLEIRRLRAGFKRSAVVSADVVARV